MESAAADENHDNPLTRTLQQERERLLRAWLHEVRQEAASAARDLHASLVDLALAAWYSTYVKERAAFKQVDLDQWPWILPDVLFVVYTPLGAAAVLAPWSPQGLLQ